MAGDQSVTEPLCDTSILKMNRVLLVKELVLENVMSSVKPFLMYAQIDDIYGGKTRGQQIQILLDKLQLLVAAGQYGGFNAFLLAMAGTQPDLFTSIMGRTPSVIESDFCMRDVAEVMKTTIQNTEHCTDSALDEQIDFNSDYIEVSILDRDEWSQGENLNENEVPPQEANGRDRNISACEVLDKADKMVSIYGRAGVGKSTTLQFMAKQWALGKWATDFMLLFLLQLRFLTNRVIAISTVQLLQLYGLYDFPAHSRWPCFSSWLRNCKSRILILIDGLDEIPGFADRMMNTPKICDIFQEAHPVDLCINILRGDLLPGCTVISASRPFAGLSQLSADVKAEILGLTSAKVTEYVENRHPHHAKNIISILTQNQLLLSICTITFYCMMITRLLSEGVIISDEDINSYTRLMSFIVVQHCCRKITDSNFQMEVSPYFSKLAQLAHTGIFQLDGSKNLAKLAFDEEDMMKCNITSQDLENMKKIGILQITRRVRGRNDSWIGEFFHLSAQELLAVAHFLLNPQFLDQNVNLVLQNGQFNLVPQFMFGLHFDRNNSWVRKICTAVSSQSGITVIKSKLSELIDSSLNQKLKVCQWIYEGRWEEKAKEVFSHIAPDGKLGLYSTMTAIDLLALDYVCQCGGSLSSISFRYVHADDTFVKVLLSSLCEHHWETLQILNLGYNCIGDIGATVIAECLLKDAVSVNNTHMLKTLNLSFNRIGDEGAKTLGRMLTSNDNLQELDVSRNEIGHEGVKALISGLKCNTSLRALKLHESNASGTGAVAISEMLQQNTCLKVLGLGACGVGDDGAQALAHGLTKNNTLTELYLHSNGIGDKGTASLATSLCHNTSLQMLDVLNNCIEDAGAVALANMLCQNTILKELFLSDNSIEDAGAIAIAGAFHSTVAQMANIPVVTQGDVAGNRGSWYEWIISLCSAGIYVPQYSTTERIDADPVQYGTAQDTMVSQTQCSTTGYVHSDLTQSNVTQGAGINPTQCNTTLKRLVIRGTNIGPEGRKALAGVKVSNASLHIELE